MKLTDPGGNWKPVALMEESRTYFGAAMFASRCLIVSGGLRNNVPTDSVVLYNKHISMNGKIFHVLTNPYTVIHLCPAIKVFSLLVDLMEVACHL